MLQSLDDRLHLLSDTYRISLREINHPIESIRDGEDRQEIGILQFHIRNHLFTNSSILIDAEEKQHRTIPFLEDLCYLGNILQGMISRLLTYAYQAHHKVATICLRQNAHLLAVLLSSFPFAKPSNKTNFDSESKFPFTVTSEEEERR